MIIITPPQMRASHSTSQEKKMKDVDTKRPRRLDLDAPLLSTRRSTITSGTSIELSLHSSADRVPFSWEHSPGKPKHAFRARNAVEVNKVLPLPKPPLVVGCQDEDEPPLTSLHENDDYITDPSFSDAIDLFSLEGSFDTDDRLDFESKTNGNDYSTSNEPWSPNFMIQRFLPAATALAASSLSAIAAASKDNDDIVTGDNSSLCSSNHPNFMAVYKSSNHFCEGSRLPRVTGEAYSSTRSCGFQMFFPWRTKHGLCGVKSPVRRVRSTLKPQLSSRN